MYNRGVYVLLHLNVRGYMFTKHFLEKSFNNNILRKRFLNPVNTKFLLRHVVWRVSCCANVFFKSQFVMVPLKLTLSTFSQHFFLDIS